LLVVTVSVLLKAAALPANIAVLTVPSAAPVAPDQTG